MRWLPDGYLLSHDISELNFAKKYRGKKPSQQQNIIPANITRKHCVSKASEIFDLSGKITAITETMTLDFHKLEIRDLDWDDVLPDELRPIWVSQFEKDKKKFQIKLLDQIRLIREEITAMQIENVLKHSLDITDTQYSDENNVFMANKQQLYYN